MQRQPLPSVLLIGASKMVRSLLTRLRPTDHDRFLIRLSSAQGAARRKNNSAGCETNNDEIVLSAFQFLSLSLNSIARPANSKLTLGGSDGSNRRGVDPDAPRIGWP